MSRQFTRIFSEIVTDIREKLVEEPWYGRPLDRHPPTHEAGEPANLAALMGWAKKSDAPGDHPRALDAPQIDLEPDWEPDLDPDR